MFDSALSGPRARAAQGGFAVKPVGELPRTVVVARRSSSSFSLYALFFCSGAIGLAFEVLWLRQIADRIGGTTPASAAALAGVFAGMAAGSALFGPVSASCK